MSESPTPHRRRWSRFNWLVIVMVIAVIAMLVCVELAFEEADRQQWQNEKAGLRQPQDTK
jgi:hypothetical protein